MESILGERIRALRLEKGLSQADLSKVFDKSDSVSRMWELGKTKPDVDTLVKMAEYFDCSSDYLLGLSEYRNTAAEIEIKSILSNIELNISNVQGDLHFDFCRELNDFFENTKELKDMPILSTPTMLELHLDTAVRVLHLLADSAMIVALAEDLQRTYTIPDNLSSERLQAHIESAERIADVSYGIIDSIIPTFMELAVKASISCTNFLDFMYKGVVSGKSTVSTTVSELLELSEQIKKNR